MERWLKGVFPEAAVQNAAMGGTTHALYSLCLESSVDHDVGVGPEGWGLLRSACVDVIRVLCGAPVRGQRAWPATHEVWPSLAYICPSLCPQLSCACCPAQIDVLFAEFTLK